MPPLGLGENDWKTRTLNYGQNCESMENHDFTWGGYSFEGRGVSGFRGLAFTALASGKVSIFPRVKDD